MKSQQVKIRKPLQGIPMQEGPLVVHGIVFIFFLNTTHLLKCLFQPSITFPLTSQLPAGHCIFVFSAKCPLIRQFPENITWCDWVFQETRNFHFRGIQPVFTCSARNVCAEPSDLCTVYMVRGSHRCTNWTRRSENMGDLCVIYRIGLRISPCLDPYEQG